MKISLILCLVILSALADRLHAAEPEAYYQATAAAQAHAENPAGWVAPNLRTVTGPGDGNTWSGGKVLVRAFTDPRYYNLTAKKFQDLYPGALWVTTGNELPAWYRDPANGVNASNIARKSVELHGLPTSSMQNYKAVVEILVDSAKLVRPTRDPNVAAQPTALPTEPFAAKPATMTQADYDAYKAWYTANISSSYGAANPDKRYPWTQLGYTYNWGGSQDTLASITGLSEFVVLGTRSGVTSPLETFAVYSIQSYLYRVGSDGDGAGNFLVNGPLDTLWSGTKFQPTGNSITIGPGAVVSGGEGIYLSSGGYTVTNNGSIIGPTGQKYYGDAPAGSSVYFLDGGSLINGPGGQMSGDGIAIEGHATGGGVSVTNHGYITGSSYAVRTGAGNDTLTIENGGILRGAVALGTGSDQITVKAGGTWQPVLNSGNGTSMLQAADIAIQNGSVITPVIATGGLLPPSSTHVLTLGTVAGSFTTLQDQYPLFDFSVIISGGVLQLGVTRVPYGEVATSVDPGLAPLASALYQQLGNPSGDMSTVLANIDVLSSAGEVAGAMRQLSPGVNTALPQIAFSADRSRLSLLPGSRSPFTDQLMSDGTSGVRYASLGLNNDGDPSLLMDRKQHWRGFAIVAGGWGRQETLSQLPGFSYDSWWSLAGMEKRISSTLVAGFALGGSRIDVKSHDAGSSSMTVDSINPAAFAAMDLGRLHADLMLGYSYNRYSSNRRIVFGGINRIAAADYDGHQLSGLVSAAYRFKPQSALYLEPVAGIYMSGLFQEAYEESGAGAASLNVGSNDYWSLRSRLGPRLGVRLRPGGLDTELQLAALWEHEFNSRQKGLTASFAGTGSSFRTEGAHYDQDSVNASLKLHCRVGRAVSIAAEYGLDASDSSMANSIRLGLEWLF